MSKTERSPESWERQKEYQRQRNKEHPEYHLAWRHRTGRSSPKGSPEHLAKIAANRRPVDVRFWAKVQKTRTCWLWIGAFDRGGYGFFENRRAHRLSYEWAIGPIPPGFQVDHLCFVRNCVNPKHLEAVTPAENTRRSIAAGRR